MQDVHGASLQLHELVALIQHRHRTQTCVLTFVTAWARAAAVWHDRVCMAARSALPQLVELGLPIGLNRVAIAPTH